MTHQFIKTFKEDAIYRISLNRPEKLNAFNLKLIEELVSELKNADRDDDIKVIIVSGEGKAFSAGGDLENMAKDQDMFAGDQKKLKDLYQTGIQQIPLVFKSISKPTIAMVHGAAVGAGCDLSLMCDLRIVSENSFFMESFINLSIISGDGGSYFMTKLIGPSRTMELMLTGRKLKAKEALEIGLVNKVVKENELLLKTYEFAKKISKSSLVSLKRTKKIVLDSTSSTLEDHLEIAAEVQSHAQREDEHKALVKKFFN